MDTKSKLTLEELVADYMRANHCSREEASERVALVCATRNVSADRLVRLVAAMMAGTTVWPAGVLLWLEVTAAFEQTQNGNELLVMLGTKAAARCGVMPELIAQLQTIAKATAARSKPTTH
jgi:hypothetical protein